MSIGTLIRASYKTRSLDRGRQINSVFHKITAEISHGIDRWEVQ